MSSGLRVLHVMWQMSIGGAERAVYQLIREQRRRGVDADVLVATEAGYYGELVATAGATVLELGCRSALDVRRSLRLTSLAADYSIVHAHGIEPLLLTAAVRAAAPRRVYTHRGGIRNHGLLKRIRVAVGGRALRKFDALSANTRQSARVIAQITGVDPERVSVVYNGLDFDLLAPLRPSAVVGAELPDHTGGRPIVATASRLQPLKRVELLLSALAALPDSSYHCLVIGDGPSKTDLERQVERLGLGDRVSFLGRKEHIGDYLQLVDVFVLPSGPEEAFGNAAVEAMGVGIPTVVFSDGGGLTEHVEHRVTGLVVNDVEELADALLELENDEGLRHDLGARGREHVRSKYSVDAMFDRYRQVYELALRTTR